MLAVGPYGLKHISAEFFCIEVKGRAINSVVSRFLVIIDRYDNPIESRTGDANHLGKYVTNFRANFRKYYLRNVRIYARYFAMKNGVEYLVPKAFAMGGSGGARVMNPHQGRQRQATQPRIQRRFYFFYPDLQVLTSRLLSPNRLHLGCVRKLAFYPDQQIYDV